MESWSAAWRLAEAKVSVCPPRDSEIYFRTEWVLPGSMLHPPTKFHGNRVSRVAVRFSAGRRTTPTMDHAINYVLLCDVTLTSCFRAKKPFREHFDDCLLDANVCRNFGKHYPSAQLFACWPFLPSIQNITSRVLLSPRTTDADTQTLNVTTALISLRVDRRCRGSEHTTGQTEEKLILQAAFIFYML